MSTIFVLDTNVLVDYMDIIPSVDGSQPAEPTIALNESHIVIPSVVIRELSKFKNEKTDRGKAARTILKRLRELAEKNVYDMRDIYNLNAPIQVKDCFSIEDYPDSERVIELQNSKQQISILPVHKDFRHGLPFHPSDSDMDGQIILTALTVGIRQHEMSVDGTVHANELNKDTFDDVILVTNDNGLAIRARERGLKTERYGYKYPDAYTGRREVIVPKELFSEFYNSRAMNADIWRQYMSEQPPLLANEFIVMRLADEKDYPIDFDPRNNCFFQNIGRYDARDDTIYKLKYCKDFPTGIRNVGQAIYAEALMDPDIAAVVCTGPAGSGKTYMSTIYGYEACKQGLFIGVTVVPCDTKRDLGALPGDLDEKMDPEVQPLKNALRNYLLKSDKKFRKQLETRHKFGGDEECMSLIEDEKSRKKSGICECSGKKSSIKAQLKDHVDLIWDNWFSNIPIEHARGRDFSHEIAIFDEFQDQTVSQADTLIKRLGSDGKIIITGDIDQIHAPYIDSSSSGLNYASRILMDSPMVAQVCFTEDEVVRHELVKMIAKRQKESTHS